MNAQEAIKVLEGTVDHYKKAMPESIKNVEEAISALKEHIQGRTASQIVANLDMVADQIESESPVIAMALDRISDIMERHASINLALQALKSLWDKTKDDREMFLKKFNKKNIEELKHDYNLSDLEINQHLKLITNGAVSLKDVLGKTSGYLSTEM